jgi:hypothetical protein
MRARTGGVGRSHRIAATILDKMDGPSTRPQVDYSSYLDAEGVPSRSPHRHMTTSRTLDPAIVPVLGSTWCSGATLTIPAGTRSSPERRGAARGDARRERSQRQRAHFTAGASPTPGAGSASIAGAGAVADIDQALIEYATTAIDVDQADAVTISNSRIERFKETGIAMVGVGRGHSDYDRRRDPHV